MSEEGGMTGRSGVSETGASASGRTHDAAGSHPSTGGTHCAASSTPLWCALSVSPFALATALSVVIAQRETPAQAETAATPPMSSTLHPMRPIRRTAPRIRGCCCTASPHWVGRMLDTQTTCWPSYAHHSCQMEGGPSCWTAFQLRATKLHWSPGRRCTGLALGTCCAC